jgi:hypothetical protein
MSFGPIAISRRHVLGDLYARCDAIESVPVYMDNVEGELLGHVDEGLGHYADAFRFHLSEDICKKLSAGHFTYSFNYEHTEDGEKDRGRRRIKLNAVLLNARKGYAKPVPKTKASAAAKEAAPAETAAVEAAEQQA